MGFTINEKPYTEQELKEILAKNPKIYQINGELFVEEPQSQSPTRLLLPDILGEKEIRELVAKGATPIVRDNELYLDLSTVKEIPEEEFRGFKNAFKRTAYALKLGTEQAGVRSLSTLFKIADGVATVFGADENYWDKWVDKMTEIEKSLDIKEIDPLEASRRTLFGMTAGTLASGVASIGDSLLFMGIGGVSGLGSRLLLSQAGSSILRSGVPFFVGLGASSASSGFGMYFSSIADFYKSKKEELELYSRLSNRTITPEEWKEIKIKLIPEANQHAWAESLSETADTALSYSLGLIPITKILPKLPRSGVLLARVPTKAGRSIVSYGARTAEELPFEITSEMAANVFQTDAYLKSNRKIEEFYAEKKDEQMLKFFEKNPLPKEDSRPIMKQLLDSFNEVAPEVAVSVAGMQLLFGGVRGAVALNNRSIYERTVSKLPKDLQEYVRGFEDKLGKDPQTLALIASPELKERLDDVLTDEKTPQGVWDVLQDVLKSTFAPDKILDKYYESLELQNNPYAALQATLQYLETDEFKNFNKLRADQFLSFKDKLEMMIENKRFSEQVAEDPNRNNIEPPAQPPVQPPTQAQAQPSAQPQSQPTPPPTVSGPPIKQPQKFEKPFAFKKLEAYEKFEKTIEAERQKAYEIAEAEIKKMQETPFEELLEKVKIEFPIQVKLTKKKAAELGKLATNIKEIVVIDPETQEEKKLEAKDIKEIKFEEVKREIKKEEKPVEIKEEVKPQEKQEEKEEKEEKEEEKPLETQSPEVKLVEEKPQEEKQEEEPIELQPSFTQLVEEKPQEEKQEEEKQERKPEERKTSDLSLGEISGIKEKETEQQIAPEVLVQELAKAQEPAETTKAAPIVNISPLQTGRTPPKRYSFASLVAAVKEKRNPHQNTNSIIKYSNLKVAPETETSLATAAAYGVIRSDLQKIPNKIKAVGQPLEKETDVFIQTSNNYDYKKLEKANSVVVAQEDNKEGKLPLEAYEITEVTEFAPDSQATIAYWNESDKRELEQSEFATELKLEVKNVRDTKPPSVKTKPTILIGKNIPLYYASSYDYYYDLGSNKLYKVSFAPLVKYLAPENSEAIATTLKNIIEQTTRQYEKSKVNIRETTTPPSLQAFITELIGALNFVSGKIDFDNIKTSIPKRDLKKIANTINQIMASGGVQGYTTSEFILVKDTASLDVLLEEILHFIDFRNILPDDVRQKLTLAIKALVPEEDFSECFILTSDGRYEWTKRAHELFVKLVFNSINNRLLSQKQEFQTELDNKLIPELRTALALLGLFAPETVLSGFREVRITTVLENYMKDNTAILEYLKTEGFTEEEYKKLENMFYEKVRGFGVSRDISDFIFKFITVLSAGKFKQNRDKAVAEKAEEIIEARIMPVVNKLDCILEDYSDIRVDRRKDENEKFTPDKFNLPSYIISKFIEFFPSNNLKKYEERVKGEARRGLLKDTSTSKVARKAFFETFLSLKALGMPPSTYKEITSVSTGQEFFQRIKDFSLSLLVYLNTHAQMPERLTMLKRRIAERTLELLASRKSGEEAIAILNDEQALFDFMRQTVLSMAIPVYIDVEIDPVSKTPILKINSSDIIFDEMFDIVGKDIYARALYLLSELKADPDLPQPLRIEKVVWVKQNKEVVEIYPEAEPSDLETMDFTKMAAAVEQPVSKDELDKIEEKREMEEIQKEKAKAELLKKEVKRVGEKTSKPEEKKDTTVNIAKAADETPTPQLELPLIVSRFISEFKDVNDQAIAHSIISFSDVELKYLLDFLFTYPNSKEHEFVKSAFLKTLNYIKTNAAHLVPKKSLVSELITKIDKLTQLITKPNPQEKLNLQNQFLPIITLTRMHLNDLSEIDNLTSQYKPTYGEIHPEEEGTEAKRNKEDKKEFEASNLTKPQTEKPKPQAPLIYKRRPEVSKKRPQGKALNEFVKREEIKVNTITEKYQNELTKKIIHYYEHKKIEDTGIGVDRRVSASVKAFLRDFKDQKIINPETNEPLNIDMYPVLFSKFLNYILNNYSRQRDIWEDFVQAYFDIANILGRGLRNISAYIHQTPYSLFLEIARAKKELNMETEGEIEEIALEGEKITREEAIKFIETLPAEEIKNIAKELLKRVGVEVVEGQPKKKREKKTAEKQIKTLFSKAIENALKNKFQTQFASYLEKGILKAFEEGTLAIRSTPYPPSDRKSIVLGIVPDIFEAINTLMQSKLLSEITFNDFEKIIDEKIDVLKEAILEETYLNEIKKTVKNLTFSFIKASINEISELYIQKLTSPEFAKELVQPLPEKPQPLPVIPTQPTPEPIPTQVGAEEVRKEEKKEKKEKEAKEPKVKEAKEKEPAESVLPRFNLILETDLREKIERIIKDRLFATLTELRKLNPLSITDDDLLEMEFWSKTVSRIASTLARTIINYTRLRTKEDPEYSVSASDLGRIFAKLWIEQFDLEKAPRDQIFKAIKQFQYIMESPELAEEAWELAKEILEDDIIAREIKTTISQEQMDAIKNEPYKHGRLPFTLINEAFKELINYHLPTLYEEYYAAQKGEITPPEAHQKIFDFLKQLETKPQAFLKIETNLKRYIYRAWSNLTYKATPEEKEANRQKFVNFVIDLFLSDFGMSGVGLSEEAKASIAANMEEILGKSFDKIWDELEAHNTIEEQLRGTLLNALRRNILPEKIKANKLVAKHLFSNLLRALPENDRMAEAIQNIANRIPKAEKKAVLLSVMSDEEIKEHSESLRDLLLNLKQLRDDKNTPAELRPIIDDLITDTTLWAASLAQSDEALEKIVTPSKQMLEEFLRALLKPEVLASNSSLAEIKELYQQFKDTIGYEVLSLPATAIEKRKEILVEAIIQTIAKKAGKSPDKYNAIRKTLTEIVDEAISKACATQLRKLLPRKEKPFVPIFFDSKLLRCAKILRTASMAFKGNTEEDIKRREEVLDLISEVWGVPRFTATDMEEIQKYVDDVLAEYSKVKKVLTAGDPEEEVIQPLINFNSPAYQALINKIAAKVPPSRFDKFMGIFYGNIFSGITTLTTNLVNTSINAFFQNAFYTLSHYIISFREQGKGILGSTLKAIPYSAKTMLNGLIHLFKGSTYDFFKTWLGGGAPEGAPVQHATRLQQSALLEHARTVSDPLSSISSSWLKPMRWILGLSFTALKYSDIRVGRFGLGASWGVQTSKMIQEYGYKPGSKEYAILQTLMAMDIMPTKERIDALAKEIKEADLLNDDNFVQKVSLWSERGRRAFRVAVSSVSGIPLEEMTAERADKVFSKLSKQGKFIVSRIFEQMLFSYFPKEKREYLLRQYSASTYNSKTDPVYDHTFLGHLANIISDWQTNKPKLPQDLGTFGKFGASIDRLSRNASRFALFALNVLSRCFNASMEWSPWGLVRIATMRRLQKEYYIEDERIYTVGLTTALGTTMLGLLAIALAQNIGDDDDDPRKKLIELDIDGPKDEKKKEVWRASGHSYYTLWICGHRIPIMLTPPAVPLFILGKVYEYFKYNSKYDEDIPDKAAGAIYAGFTGTLSSFLNLSYFSGMGEILSSIHSGSVDNRGMQMINNMFIGSIPYLGMNLYRQILDHIDGTMYDRPYTKESFDKYVALLLRQMPLPACFKKGKLLPLINALGEPVIKESPLLPLVGAQQLVGKLVGDEYYGKTARGAGKPPVVDEAWLILSENGLGLSSVSPTITLGGLVMPDNIRYVYSIIRGNLLKQAIKGDFFKPILTDKSLPKNVKQEILDRMDQTADSIAKELLLTNEEVKLMIAQWGKNLISDEELFRRTLKISQKEYLYDILKMRLNQRLSK